MAVHRGVHLHRGVRKWWACMHEVCMYTGVDTWLCVGGVNGIVQCTFNSAQVQLSTSLLFFQTVISRSM